MTSRGMRALAVTGAIGLTGGCSLVADLSQFDNATIAEDSGARDSSATSDGRMSDSAVVPDDSGEVPVVDGGDDAGDARASDASDGSPSDEASTRYCVVNASSTSLFCDDFDDGRSLSAGFGIGFGMLGDGGSISETQVGTIQSMEFLSPPSALLIATDSIPAGGYGNRQLVNHLTNHSTVNLIFSIMIPDLDPTVGDLSLVRIADSSGQWGVSWDLTGSSGQLLEAITPPDGGPPRYNSHSGLSLPPSGMWITVDLGINLNTNTLSMTTSPGDGGAAMTVFSGEPISPPSTLIGGSLAVIIGVNYLQGPAQPMHIYYDDVQVLAN